MSISDIVSKFSKYRSKDLFKVSINLYREEETRKLASHLMAKIRLAGLAFNPEEFEFLSKFNSEFGVDENYVKSIVGFAGRYPIRKEGKIRGVFKSDVEESFHIELEKFMDHETCFVSKDGEPVFFEHDFKEWLASKGCAV